MYFFVNRSAFIFVKSNHISFFRALVAGGGAPEIEASVKLMNYAKELTGKEAYCFKEFAQALEIIPYTLAENAGLSPIAVVTELRNKHAQGEKNYGINVRKVSDFAHYLVKYLWFSTQKEGNFCKNISAMLALIVC